MLWQSVSRVLLGEIVFALFELLTVPRLLRAEDMQSLVGNEIAIDPAASRIWIFAVTLGGPDWEGFPFEQHHDFSTMNYPLNFSGEVWITGVAG